jgi:hypothetical protein
MSVPAAKVKAVCTSSEAALVRASRGPALGQLNYANVKQHVAQARKLADKWEGLARGQSRERRRQSGSSEVDANTRLKAEIFREALSAFEARLKALDKAAPSPAARSSSSKRSRSTEHRATRAAVRQDLTTAKKQRNEAAAKQKLKKLASVKKVSSEPKAAALAPAEAVAKPTAKASKSRVLAKPVRVTGANLATSQVAPAKQLRAATVAKQARVAASGKASRAIGHTIARGKRTQARRDARN